MSRARGFAVAAGALLALTACTADEPDGSAPPGPSVPSGEATTAPGGSARPATPSTEATPVPAAPKPRACYRLTFDELTAPSNDSRPVSCKEPHNTQTIHVGRLDAVVDGHLVAVDSRRVEQQLATTCPRQLRSYVGGSDQLRDLSRFTVVWFSPTVEESDQGANWFRCDLVALAGQGRLARLPGPGALSGALDRPGALEEYGLCGTAAPGSTGFTRVICSRRHSWRAVATIPLSGTRYPGTAVVRRAGDDSCRDEVADRLGPADRFQYGWEWPTREQWDNGQRYGYCWAPD